MRDHQFATTHLKDIFKDSDRFHFIKSKIKIEKWSLNTGILHTKPHYALYAQPASSWQRLSFQSENDLQKSSEITCCWFHPRQEGTLVTACSGAFSSPREFEASPLHFMLYWKCSQNKWEEIGVNITSWSDSLSGKVLFYADDTMFYHYNKMLWMLIFTWLTVGNLAVKTQLNLQQCVRPCCWFARCSVSRTRWAQGVHAEVHTPAPQARRQPPPHRWVPAGNRLSGLRWEQRNVISFGSPLSSGTDRWPL